MALGANVIGALERIAARDLPPSADGEPATFVDQETGEEVALEPWEVRAAYQQRLAAWGARYRDECRRAQIDYVTLDTDTPYDQALYRYLEKRRRLH